MREWCRRADVRDALSKLLEGEDEDFRQLISRIAAQSQSAPARAAVD